MNDDPRIIDLSNLDQSIPMTHLLLLVSIAVAAFFLGGALTTEVTAATWVIVFILVGYIGFAVHHITNTLIDTVHAAAREGVLVTEASFQEDIEGLSAAVLDFTEVGFQIMDEVATQGQPHQSLKNLREILTAIGAVEETT